MGIVRLISSTWTFHFKFLKENLEMRKSTRNILTWRHISIFILKGSFDPRLGLMVSQYRDPELRGQKEGSSI